ncbi:MAG: glycosyltransferase, partial [Myxococcota bacterium]
MQSQIWRLTEALDDLGLHQTVLTLKIPGTPIPWHMSERTQVWGVRVPVFPFRSRIRGMVDLNLSWALGVIKKVRSENIRPDIVHIHCSGVYLPPLIGHLISRLTQAPLVTTIHCSILGTYHPMSMLDRVTQPMARQVERQAIRASARTITLTPKSIDLLQKETGVDTSRFAVLPDIIDAEAFAARANDDAVETLRQRWRIPSDRRIVGYVGRIAREKGWPILLDIAEKLKDEPIHWLICGDGNERDLFERDIR